MKLNIIRPPLLLTFLLFVYAGTNAQQNKDKGIRMYSQRLQEKLKPSSLQFWLDIRPDEKINPADFLTNFKLDLKLTAADEFKLLQELKDQDGNTHNKFQQYYKGIKVEGAECIVHELKGFVKSVNGRWVSGINLAATPAIKETGALNYALASMTNKNFIWLNKDAEKWKALIKEKDISINPKGQLVFCLKDPQKDFLADNITLAWKFTVLVNPVYESKCIYVDAGTGKIIRQQLIMPSSCNTGFGATSWYSNRYCTTTYRGWPDNAYHLDNSDGACDGRSRIASRRGDPIIPYNYGDADNNFFDADGVNGYNQKAGVTTYFALVNAYDYYKYVHGRLSYDNANAGIDAYSENNSSWCENWNARWNTVTHTLHFGSGNTSAATDDINSVDAVGHEFTHGVVQFSANLNYSYESGALNESFADIFGEMVEGSALGSVDWQMGTEIGSPIRSFNNPNSHGQPDTYGGSYWYSGAADNGGVHTNSGVQNYWFYLLSVGGSGTNDATRTFNVAGLGTTKARSIAYRNLTYYLVSSSVYTDAREGAIRAATDLYGSCSNEVLQTANAWYAAGVGYNEYNNGAAMCGNYISVGLPAFFKNPGAIYLGQTCVINFSSTGLGGNYIASGTSITMFPGATASPLFIAYIDPCAVAAYSLTPEQPNSNAGENAVAKSTNNLNSKGIEKNVLVSATVYPNPASSFITIKTNIAINRNLCLIVDVSGKKTACSFINSNTVDVSKLSPGIYFLNITNEGKTEALKFIKQ